MMKLRKPISAVLAAAMLTSSVSIVSYAAEDEAMKQALTYVKERVEIPEEYSEFNHTKRTSYGATQYNFSWYDEQRNYIEVSICGKVITNYYRYHSDMYKSNGYAFAKLTKEKLAAKAQEALEKLNPTVAKLIEMDAEKLSVSVSSNRASVPIYRVKNGVRISGQTGRVTVDKDTGELLSFSLNWMPGATFADSKKAISKEKAMERFCEHFPISKLYTLEYDWQEGTYTPHLIYKRDIIGQIDALTGEIATFEGSYGYYASDDMADEDVSDDDDDDVSEGATANGVSFSEQEKEKMELEATLLKAEDALDAMKRSGVYSIPDAAKVSGENTYYDSRSKTYISSFTIQSYQKYESIDGGDQNPYTGPALEVDDVVEIEDGEVSVYYGSCTMNAETGEVLHFSGNDLSGKSKKIKTEEEAQAIVKQRLAEIAGKKATEFKLDEFSYYVTNTDKEGRKTEKSTIQSASASSPRYAYDIPCQAEDVTIRIDASGRVSTYDINYYGIEYPKPEKILTEEEIYQKYFEATDYELLYRIAYNYDRGRVETALVYNAGADFRVDAFTGKLVRYDGAEIPEKTVSGYTDLERSGYRKEAEKLALYGITLMDEDGRLNADMTITRDDFSDLIRYIGCYGRVENGEKPLTRKYAAKLLTQNMASSVAELPNLFKSPFSDVKEDDPYVGYIAIANALGLMSGEDGKFRPSAKMTRGDALLLVYDYLSK